MPTDAAFIARMHGPPPPQVPQLGALLLWLRDDRNRARITSAAGTGIVQILLLLLLTGGIGGVIVTRVSEEMKLFDVVEPIPPPPPATPPPPKRGETRKTQTPRPEGAASPKNLRDTPKEIVAPPPRLPVPPPIVAAPIAGQGNVAAAGAADTPGPGTGSGGIGSGTGSGRFGDGTGGGGGGIAVHARLISGRIRDSDYPRAAFEAGASGVVHISFVVQPNGRVTGCRVVRSSGRSDLDSTTCRLIEARLRYRPARDYAGRPIPEVIRGVQEWQASRQPDVYIDAVPYDYD